MEPMCPPAIKGCLQKRRRRHVLDGSAQASGVNGVHGHCPADEPLRNRVTHRS